ncbi:MAG TPA: sulfite oxidase-like oxidoreductase [Solirubrobacteraceae bacterium]|jgi:DMSO/TMAO reductase YedYZ molybdopterin-dependent catalytic subunit|nr:sulfite oxidase-like oxidoreductase [Solirubrobacteraceae bacterium]
MATRGFFGRQRAPAGVAERLPPGQYLEEGFPVLTAGATPRVATSEWSFTLDGLVGERRTWSWEEAHALEGSGFEGDIHCVTRWSKLGTSFAGVSVDTLLDLAGVDEAATHALASCYGGYTTNLPLADVRGGRAWIVWEYEGRPLPAEHGGPARLLVPHLYFWKSAKWVKGLTLLDHNEPGFWEQYGYHDYGDPWKEQRFQGD